MNASKRPLDRWLSTLDKWRLWNFYLSTASGHGRLARAGCVSVLAHVLVLALAPRPVAVSLSDASRGPERALQWRVLAAIPERSGSGGSAGEGMRPVISPAVSPVPAGDRATRVTAKRSAMRSPQDQPLKPRPRENPQFGAIRIAGFRLPLQLWVGLDGRIQALTWGDNELPQPILDAMAAALRQVRFVPAFDKGRPVAAALRLNLCFDDDGQLRAFAPECWDPDAVR
jgi:hypothetical protein